jgi:hypothetical protein
MHNMLCVNAEFKVLSLFGTACMKASMLHSSNKGRTGLLPSLVHGGAQRVNEAQSLVEQFEREQVTFFAFAFASLEFSKPDE